MTSRPECAAGRLEMSQGGRKMHGTGSYGCAGCQPREPEEYAMRSRNLFGSFRPEEARDAQQ
jgi:hypothetical protein